MKLAGPVRSVRFVLGVETTTAVVCGVFPPERAPAFRAFAAAMAKEADPMLRASWRDVTDRMIEHMIYGKPLSFDKPPVGIMGRVS